MPKIHVDKSVVINAKPQAVYESLLNYKNWLHWSPWLITEPEAKLTYSDDGNFYQWEGDLVGTGNMRKGEMIENKEIKMLLTFVKPWKSKADITFKLIEEGEGTRLHWIMDNSLPFFMFWMKKMMTVFVGMDFQKGLNMLKEYIETRKVSSELTFKGIQNYEGCQYIGIKSECSIDDLGPTMQRDYERLMPYMMQNYEDKVAGNGFSIYHKWEMVKNKVVYTAAVPVNEMPPLEPGMISGTVPAMKVHVVHHKGSYLHVGNAWSAQITRQRAKTFNSNKKIPPMEVYLNSPKDTPEAELESEILFAVK